MAVRIPNCDVMDSVRNHCIGGGDNGSGHTTDAHKDVEVEIAVHAFLGVRMGHCNQRVSNEHLCLLPSFSCSESCYAQEVVSTAIAKKTGGEWTM